MKVLLVYNAADQRCGFANFGAQSAIALERAGCAVTVWDGTYPSIYHRRERGEPTFFPDDVESYDVVHLIWNALTLNHYTGAVWPRHPVISWWDGGPSDAYCPFKDAMQVRWSDYPRDGYEYLWYPVPDWVTDLPTPDPGCLVGASSVRGDGVALIRLICERRGWALNLPDGQWRTLEDEIRRLARSTVNVCWYHTPALWHNRASAPSMLLAARRPLLINRDPLTAHLWDQRDIYQAPLVGGGDDVAVLETALDRILDVSEYHRQRPLASAATLSWSVAAARFCTVWAAAQPLHVDQDRR